MVSVPEVLLVVLAVVPFGTAAELSAVTAAGVDELFEAVVLLEVLVVLLGLLLAVVLPAG